MIGLLARIFNDMPDDSFYVHRPSIQARIDEDGQIVLYSSVVNELVEHDVIYVTTGGFSTYRIEVKDGKPQFVPFDRR